MRKTDSYLPNTVYWHQCPDGEKSSSENMQKWDTYFGQGWKGVWKNVHLKDGNNLKDDYSIINPLIKSVNEILLSNPRGYYLAFLDYNNKWVWQGVFLLGSGYSSTYQWIPSPRAMGLGSAPWITDKTQGSNTAPPLLTLLHIHS